jgi:glycosyltransferase involved in cell wall biosynthesis
VPRIAYISFDQVPAAKGASTHIEAFVRGLASEFGQVDLVTPANFPAGPLQRWPGVVHSELPANGPSLIDRVLSFRRHLEPWLATRQFDVIHFRSPFEGMAVLKHRKDAALLFEVNGLPSIELKYRYPGSEDDRELMHKIEAQERACLSAAGRIVTPSEVTGRFLVAARGARPGRIAVIPNGADTSLFRPANQPSGEACWKLLYFGTLSPWQGVDLAIRAVAQLEDVFLRVIGTGSRTQFDSLTRLAGKLGVEKRVTLRPPVAQVELSEELAACHAVISPLTWNDRNVVQGCCPLKVLEGMAAGRPVISSDLEVLRCMGLNDEQLILCKPGSVDAIVQAVVRLREDPAWAEVLGRNARRIVEERFTWKHALESLRGVYRDLIGGKAHPAPAACVSARG